MITANDIGKTVFLRLQPEGQHVAKWENEGCILRGFAPNGTALLVEMPNGAVWALNPKVVRIFEPRPK